MIRNLLSHIVDETLPCQFIVRLEYVMNLIDDMIVVTHRMALQDIVQSNDLSVLAI